MTDVTSILAADTAAAAAAEDGAEDVAMGAGGGLGGIPLAAGASRGRKRLALPKKPAGMSREVYELMVKQGVDLPTIVPAKTAAAFKARRDSGRRVKWSWKPFSNSARRDGAVFHHWAPTNREVDDYPFARFNTQVDVIRYTDEEYRRFVPHPQQGQAHLRDWNKEDTDKLFDLCRRFDLRWSVIWDRSDFHPPRSIDELKYRYYSVSARIVANRVNRPKVADTVASPEFKSLANYGFDFEHESKRRRQLEILFSRDESAAAREAQLRAELKQVDAAIKRATSNKKGQNNAGIDAILQDLPQELETLEALEGEPFPLAPAGTSLRSTLVRQPVFSASLSNKAQKKLSQMLNELKVPENPMPSKDVVEAHATLRRDLLIMMSMHKLISKREGKLSSWVTKRKKLAPTGAPTTPTSGVERQPIQHLMMPPAPAPAAVPMAMHAAPPPSAGLAEPPIHITLPRAAAAGAAVVAQSIASDDPNSPRAPKRKGGGGKPAMKKPRVGKEK